MRKWKIFLILLISTCLFSSLEALDGKIVSVNGKTEFRNSQGKWMQLQQNSSIPRGTVISTGFNSGLSIKFGEILVTTTSLTRLTFTNYTQNEDEKDIELFLEAGTINAQLPESDENNITLRITTPCVTASTSTDGSMFELGEYLAVTKGSVLFTNKIGQKRICQSGQFLFTAGSRILTTAASAQKKMNCIPLSPLLLLESPSDIQKIHGISDLTSNE